MCGINAITGIILYDSNLVKFTRIVKGRNILKKYFKKILEIVLQRSK